MSKEELIEKWTKKIKSKEDFEYYLPKYEKDRLCGVRSVLTPKVKNKYQYVIWYNK